MAAMKSRAHAPPTDAPRCPLAHKHSWSPDGLISHTPTTESVHGVRPAEAARSKQSAPSTLHPLVWDEPLVEMTRVKLYGITLLWMSIVVMLFVNILFGAFALVCSLRAHRLLQSPASEAPQQPAAADSWRVPLGHLQTARRLGRAAFALNSAGILISMLALIFAFMYFGTEPESRKSLFSVIQAFMQPSAVNHPALEKSPSVGSYFATDKTQSKP
nr:unnamed protein product [Spirometra erinaceieuropaei]